MGYMNGHYKITWPLLGIIVHLTLIEFSTNSLFIFVKLNANKAQKKNNINDNCTVTATEGIGYGPVIKRTKLHQMKMQRNILRYETL